MVRSCVNVLSEAALQAFPTACNWCRFWSRVAACRTPHHSAPSSRCRASWRPPGSSAFSVTATPGCWCYGAEKNGSLLAVWPALSRPLRPTHLPCPRSLGQQVPHLHPVRAVSGPLPKVPRRVRRAPRLAGEEPALHPALPVSLGDPTFEIIGDHDLGHAPEEGEGPDMRGRPVRQRLGPGRLGIGIVGGPQYGDEDLRLAELPGGPGAHRHGLPRVIDEELLARSMLLAQTPIQGLEPDAIPVAEAAVLVAAGCAA